jgi:hypothetical protein
LAYVEVVKKVDIGELKFRFDNGSGALKFEARDLLRRALVIGRAIGPEKAGPSAARQTVTHLRKRAFSKLLPAPALWFGHLDLDFGVTDPADIGIEVEALITALPSTVDPHGIVDLYRLGARAYHIAKRDADRHRCQSAAAEQLVTMAGQPSAMLASHILAEAIAELHGVPGKKDRRNELRHQLVDVEAGIPDEMSAFEINILKTKHLNSPQWKRNSLQSLSLLLDLDLDRRTFRLHGPSPRVGAAMSARQQLATTIG